MGYPPIRTPGGNLCPQSVRDFARNDALTTPLILLAGFLGPPHAPVIQATSAILLAYCSGDGTLRGTMQETACKMKDAWETARPLADLVGLGGIVSHAINFGEAVCKGKDPLAAAAAIAGATIKPVPKPTPAQIAAAKAKSAAIASAKAKAKARALEALANAKARQAGQPTTTTAPGSGKNLGLVALAGIAAALVLS